MKIGDRWSREGDTEMSELAEGVRESKARLGSVLYKNIFYL